MSRLVAQRFPELGDAEAAIRAGRVLVAGFPVKNPASLVDVAAPLALVAPHRLRGSAKLEAALEAFAVAVEGRVAVDIGASAGGFTQVLLERGAAKVFAADAGRGLLRDELRRDPRVVDLGGTNLGTLDRTLVPIAIDLIVIDISYTSLAIALPQLAALELAPGAELVALVKPMFELGLREPPGLERLAEALAHAAAGAERAGWTVVGSIESPVTGARGARELLLHARREVS